jgi:hypothetical protein
MPKSPIFGNAVGVGDRVQGNITPVGSSRFEQARKRLAKLADREVEQVSDGETIDYLARGHDATVKFLEKQRAAVPA